MGFRFVICFLRRVKSFSGLEVIVLRVCLPFFTLSDFGRGLNRFDGRWQDIWRGTGAV